MLSDDDAPPCDRPNLSKDYLAGNAPEEWIPLRPPEFYDRHDIELRPGTRVVAIHPNAREVELVDGSRHGYQFEEYVVWVSQYNVAYHLGVDGISAR